MTEFARKFRHGVLQNSGSENCNFPVRFLFRNRRGALEDMR